MATSVTLFPSMLVALDNEAERRGTNLSHLVREAIAEWIERKTQQEP